MKEIIEDSEFFLDGDTLLLDVDGRILTFTAQRNALHPLSSSRLYVLDKIESAIDD